MIRAVLFLFCLAASSLVPAADRVVIYVDGIDFNESFWSMLLDKKVLMGPSSDRQVNYLAPSYLGTSLANSFPSATRQILWNGDVTDKVNLRSAVDSLKADIQLYTRQGKRIDLITHSMGTIIGYIALAELSVQSKRDPLIANFVTLASPLGRQHVLVKIGELLPSATDRNPGLNIPIQNELLSPRSLRIAGKWINVYGEDDPIGGPVPTAINYPVIKDTYLPKTVGEQLNVAYKAGMWAERAKFMHSRPYEDAEVGMRLIGDLKESYNGLEHHVLTQQAVATSANQVPKPTLQADGKGGQGSSATVLGVWTGSVHQLNAETYPVIMTISATQNNSYVGTIEYPSLGCGGHLTFVAGSTGNQFIFNEKIEHGGRRCVDGGSIHLGYTASDTITWEWFYPNGTRGVYGTLAWEATSKRTPPATSIPSQKNSNISSGSRKPPSGKVPVDKSRADFWCQLRREQGKQDCSDLYR